MTEPKVEFDLNNINDPEILKVLDDVRRWYEFREDISTPAMQTFEGTLEDGQEIRLYVPGKVYGYSGMTQSGGGDYWIPMLFSAAVLSNQCYFALELDNLDGTFVKVRCSTTTANASRDFRATVFYRGNQNGN